MTANRSNRYPETSRRSRFSTYPRPTSLQTGNTPLHHGGRHRDDEGMLTGKRLDDFVHRVSDRLAEELAVAIAIQGTDRFQQSIFAALQNCLSGLAESECWGPPNQIPSSLFWDHNAELLRRGSLQLHARQKPLGYAGDFQLLDRICREDLTDDPIGRPMDEFFQAQSAPKAVRNRYRLIANIIADKVRQSDDVCRVASIGSGPAWDINWAMEKLGADIARLEITLVDIDPNALEFCRARFADRLPATNLKTIQANLGRLPRLKKVLDELDGSDLVYCPGYFDYLDDDGAVKLLRALWSCVVETGELLIFNFNANNPSRAYMEWFGNWYLIYRSAESLAQLAKETHLPGAEIAVDSEQAGVNLFLQCKSR